MTNSIKIVKTMSTRKSDFIQAIFNKFDEIRKTSSLDEAKKYIKTRSWVFSTITQKTSYKTTELKHNEKIKIMGNRGLFHYGYILDIDYSMKLEKFDYPQETIDRDKGKIFVMQSAIVVDGIKKDRLGYTELKEGELFLIDGKLRTLKIVGLSFSDMAILK